MMTEGCFSFMFKPIYCYGSAMMNESHIPTRLMNTREAAEGSRAWDVNGTNRRIKRMVENQQVENGRRIKSAVRG